LKLASVGNLTQVAENKIFKNQRAKSKLQLLDFSWLKKAKPFPMAT